jgi:hypothetical protein
LQALELQRQQEVTKQAEAKTKEAEFKAQANAYAKVHMHGVTCRAFILPQLNSSVCAALQYAVARQETAACYQLPAANKMSLGTCSTACDCAVYCCIIYIPISFAKHRSALLLLDPYVSIHEHISHTRPFHPCYVHRDTQEQEHIRWEEQRKTMSEEAQRQAQLAQYNDELARKRQQAEHELQRQRNGEMVSLQEQAAARKEAERLRIEQQIQAERRAADQYAVRSL